MKNSISKPLKTTAAILSLSALSLSLAGTASGANLDVNFGSDNDGFGGFFTTAQSSQTTFAELEDSIQVNRSSGANERSGGLWTDEFTGANALNRDDGSFYTFTTQVAINSVIGSGGAGNVALMLFSNAAETDPQGISLKMFYGTSSADSPELRIDSRVNTSDSSSSERLAWTGDSFVSGNVFTLEGIVNFTATDAIVTFNLTDSAATPTTASVTRTFDKSALVWGDVHGVGTEHNGINFDVFNYGVVVPEPSTALLLGLVGIGLVLRRRR